MADNNRTDDKRNVTGSYPGVTGSYRPTSAYPKPVPEKRDVTERTDTVKSNAQKGKRREKAGFDFKLWFSKDNVRAFMKQLRYYGIIVLVSLLLTFGIVNLGNDVFAFIKPDRESVVTIVEGSSTATVASVLKKSDIINHPLIFRLYCKLKKADGKLQFGDYSLNSNLGYDQIISKLKKPAVQAEVFTATVAPGSTQDDIVTQFTAAKYCSVTDLEAALNTYDFESYEFVSKLPDRRCRLEGYLPAGEYEFHVGESAVSMVKKMLARYVETVLTDENKALISRSGMSEDDVITLASLIQSECDDEGMYKTAAGILINRLKSTDNSFLQLTSPINYVLDAKKTALTADDTKTESDYNTYLYSGLPKGPVCNPTAAAISAVLAPEATANMYFISDGKNQYYAVSFEEHQNNLKKASDSCKGTDTIR